MTWDWLVQRTGKHCSIRRMEYPEFQTGIFGRMESALDWTGLDWKGMDWTSKTSTYKRQACKKDT